MNFKNLSKKVSYMLSFLFYYIYANFKRTQQISYEGKDIGYTTQQTILDSVVSLKFKTDFTSLDNFWAEII